MFSWLTAWWWSASSLPGPARNLPGDGTGVKQLVEQNNKHIANTRTFDLQKPDLVEQLREALSQGREEYFKSYRLRREERLKIKESKLRQQEEENIRKTAELMQRILDEKCKEVEPKVEEPKEVIRFIELAPETLSLPQNICVKLGPVAQDDLTIQDLTVPLIPSPKQTFTASELSVAVNEFHTIS